MRRRPLPAYALLAGCMALSGCSGAPSFNVLGSYFPAWMLCLVVGILLTVASRALLIRLRMEDYLLPLVLIYPCLTAFFACVLWLLFFS